jgi:DNA repair protein RecO (recombination protein O)
VAVLTSLFRFFSSLVPNSHSIPAVLSLSAIQLFFPEIIHMGQPRSFPTEAVILKQSDLGEADRIITLLTPYKGKLRTVAKGIRRPVSKKAGHLELLCHSQLQIATGRNLDIVTQVQTIESFTALRNALWHMTCGFYLAELVDHFVEDDTPQQDIYNLLLLVLRALNADALEEQQQRASDEASSISSNRDRSRLLLRYFEIALLTAVGYEPALRACSHCRAELLPRENGFNATLGGALCPDCSHFWQQTLSVNALKVLRVLQRTGWDQVPRFQLEMRLHTEIEMAMRSLLRYHLERDLKSWNFLEMLKVRP